MIRRSHGCLLAVSVLLLAAPPAVSQTVPTDHTIGEWDAIAARAELRERRAERAERAAKREAARHRRAARSADSQARRADRSIRRTMLRSRARSKESAARRADAEARREARRARSARREAQQARRASLLLRLEAAGVLGMRVQPPASPGSGGFLPGAGGPGR